MQIVDSFISNDEALIIKDYILKNEQRVKKLGPDNYSGTSADSLTGRFNVYNWLTNDTIGQILTPKLSNLFPKKWIRLWANIFRQDEGIEKHWHGYARNKSGNLFISGPNDSTTCYEIIGPIRNKVGTLVYFDANKAHWVEPNKSETPRISMAFDIFECRSRMFIQLN